MPDRTHGERVARSLDRRAEAVELTTGDTEHADYCRRLAKGLRTGRLEMETERAETEREQGRWEKVPDWPYEVSDQGRVRRADNKSSVKPWATCRNRNYRAVRLWQDGEYVRKYVHHLVLEAFVGPCPSEEHEANHKNGDGSDNRAENLEWVTRSENMQHAYDTGLLGSMTGPNNSRAKFSEAEVVDLRRRALTDEETVAGLAREKGVTSWVMRRVLTGRSYPNCGGPLYPMEADNE